LQRKKHAHEHSPAIRRDNGMRNAFAREKFPCGGGFVMKSG
jgi:hypothetical protein